MPTQSKIKRSKQNKKVKWNRLILSYISIVIFHALFIAGLAYFISPLSKVGTITVQGNEEVYDQVIIDKSSIKMGEFIYKSKDKFEESEEKIIDELVQISNSELKIEELNNIVIQVEEYNTVAYISKDEGYLRVLENGSVLDEPYSISLGNQLVLSKFKEGDALNLMIEELKEIKKPVLNLISEIELVERKSNPLFIHIYMNNGNRVLTKIPDFSKKMPYYPQMVQAVEGKKGVFDMEAGIYFIPYKDEKNVEAGVNEESGQELEDFLNGNG